MKYLLDTHILLWSLFTPEKINQSTLSILKDINLEKYISSITFWEISLKYSLGKLELTNIDPDGIYHNAIKAGYYILDIKADEFSSSFKLPYFVEHKDPFDRIIIWQALLHNMTLLTKDKKIKDYEKIGLKVVY